MTPIIPLPRKKAFNRQDSFSYTDLAVPILEYPHYEPVNPKIEAFHQRPEKIRLVIGGNQSGKTCSTTYDAICFARTHPNSVLWMCSESYALIGEVLWPTYQQFLHPDETEWKYDKIARSSYIEFKQNGSKLYPKSYEQGRRKFQSAHVHYIQFDEEPPKDIVMECIARTSATGGLLVFGMTPLMGHTYVYKELFKKADVKDYIWTTTISYLENKFIPDEQKRIIVDAYGSSEARRRVYGEWTLPEGVIFNEFQEDVNVIEPFDIPWNWPCIRALDFGHAEGHEFVCLWMAQDPETDIVYIYREHYQSGMLLEDHARIIHEASKGERIVATVGEHASQERAELENKDIFVELANKDVKYGIQVVNRFFKQREDGKCHCYIFDTCENLKDEIPQYQYDKYGKPMKRNDNACDACRYGLVELDNLVTLPGMPKGTQPLTFGEEHYY